MSENIHPKKPVFEYSRITKDIYIGTNMCCQTHFNKLLIKKKIKADISLEEKKLDQPFGVDYYLWLPTKDHQAPTLKQLLVGANFIRQLIDNKIKFYVHCEHGHARAPTLVAAYFILKGKTAKESIDIIKKKRPIIHPNNSQIKALEDFEKKVEKRW
ncbi:dual specificity protein phosphatase family protein [Candidatus Woesearchaeota archaeon]|nr:dual specificity protein phosphatase family protein [Candidatus Woesearchaeota archaeon]